MKRQWQEVEELWEKHHDVYIGPIIGHASDGDSRRRNIMIQDYLGKLHMHEICYSMGCSGLHVSNA